ncbi:MAG TPA: hypothetical protein QF630_07160, partial [Alphaproteobacteria bacterium]|nr:hypothetical protein [Alphaproteobacteria bacterium]
MQSSILTHHDPDISTLASICARGSDVETTDSCVSLIEAVAQALKSITREMAKKTAEEDAT